MGKILYFPMEDFPLANEKLLPYTERVPKIPKTQAFLQAMKEMSDFVAHMHLPPDKQTALFRVIISYAIEAEFGAYRYARTLPAEKKG